MKKMGSAAVCAAFFLACCSGCAQTGGTGESASESASSSAETVFTVQTDADMFTDRDFEAAYDESECVTIQLNGDSASASSDSVSVSGSTVTITEEATYLLSGSLENGTILVDAPDTAKIHLIFDGVTVHSETSAALTILEADKVFLTLADGTEDELSNGGSFAELDGVSVDGALFSRQDLTVNGTGALTVSSPAGHGIVCKDDLVLTGGTYDITSSFHGIDANDSIRIAENVSLTIDAGKDGLHAENNDDTSLGFVYLSGCTMQVESEGDGISAGASLQIEDGVFQILAGGGNENGEQKASDSWGGFRGRQPAEITSSAASETEESSTSMKGLKAGGTLLITDGDFSIDSADDAVHSNTSVTVNGGTFSVATGDDAFHADDTLTVTDGTIDISTCYEGFEALHVDVQGGTTSMAALDDGLNAAGGTDASGTAGGRDGMFGEAPAGWPGADGGPTSGETGSGSPAERPDNASGEAAGETPAVPPDDVPEKGTNERPDEPPDGVPGEADGNVPEERPNDGTGETWAGGGGRQGGGPGGMSGNSDGTIVISGGTLFIHASGDGIDANGSLEISGGDITIVGPDQGDTSTLDYDTSAVITGGTFFGTGASGMAQTFSDSEQGVISIRTDSQSAGTTITISSEDGTQICTAAPDEAFSMILFSSPELAAEETYTVSAGSYSGQVTAE